MGTRNHGNVVSLSLLLLFSFLVCKCSSLFDFEYVEVHVYNDIEGYEVSLDMHCQSNDDDLGLHTLRVGEEWYWRFEQSLIRNTHFWCDFRWYDNWNYRWYEGTFEVYHGNGWYDKYYAFCKYDCRYEVRRDGLYLYREDKHEMERRGTWR
ncbi:hypothetical protein MKX03_000813 [Papaver bracteatum]|nr:hypothetical protein MKX03_000813 [Papaver bracteatum]